MSPSNEWLVTLPDHPNALATRLANRPKHLEHNKPLMDEAVITFGGPLLSSHHQSEGDLMQNIVGSVHLVRADTETEVWEMVKNDPYAKLGVWDLDRVRVVPMKCFVMQSMSV